MPRLWGGDFAKSKFKQRTPKPSWAKEPRRRRFAGAMSTMGLQSVMDQMRQWGLAGSSKLGTTPDPREEAMRRVSEQQGGGVSAPGVHPPIQYDISFNDWYQELATARPDQYRMYRSMVEQGHMTWEQVYEREMQRNIARERGPTL